LTIDQNLIKATCHCDR